MNRPDRRLILLLSPFALAFGLWLGAQLPPGQDTTRWVLVAIAGLMVAVLGLWAGLRRWG